jgi:predicted AAA+ superfamily ATPase
MELQRKVDEKLALWLKGTEVLYLKGARQVGKTHSLETFLKPRFKHFIEINLALNSSLIPSFNQIKTVDNFYFSVSLASNEKIVKGETVVFIDEIQKATKFDYLTLSKFLAIDGRARVVFSGSLLGVNEMPITSYPVGYLDEVTMYPLDFEEYLWAAKVNPSLISNCRDCFSQKIPFDPTAHQIFLNHFYNYLLVGGMPAAVCAFFSSHSLVEVNRAHDIIDKNYISDVASHVEAKSRPYILDIYQTIPSEISSKNKRFVLNKIAKKYQVDKIRNDFIWLTDANIVLPVYNVEEPKSPLQLSISHSLVKLFMADVGMLTYYLLDTGVEDKIYKHEKDINYGAIFENAVAQELFAHGYSNLYYYSNKKKGEIDFITQYKGDVLPIEVKSGKDYQKHSALTNLLNEPQYDIKEAFVFSDYNVKQEGKITYYPIYMIDFLNKIS